MQNQLIIYCKANEYNNQNTINTDKSLLIFLKKSGCKTIKETFNNESVDIYHTKNLEINCDFI